MVGYVSFPLTLALSRWERERRIPRGDESRSFGLVKAGLAILPLPKGEGRGEGNSSPLKSNLELATLATARASTIDRLCA